MMKKLLNFFKRYGWLTSLSDRRQDRYKLADATVIIDGEAYELVDLNNEGIGVALRPDSQDQEKDAIKEILIRCKGKDIKIKGKIVSIRCSKRYGIKFIGKNEIIEELVENLADCEFYGKSNLMVP